MDFGDVETDLRRGNEDAPNEIRSAYLRNCPKIRRSSVPSEKTFFLLLVWIEIQFA